MAKSTCEQMKRHGTCAKQKKKKYDDSVGRTISLTVFTTIEADRNMFWPLNIVYVYALPMVFAFPTYP